MGQHAAGAILAAVFRIGEGAAALFPQGIQRTVAEQAVELLRLLRFVAGEKLTFFILEKGVVLALPIRLFAHAKGSFPPVIFFMIPCFRPPRKRGGQKKDLGKSVKENGRDCIF